MTKHYQRDKVLTCIKIDLVIQFLQRFNLKVPSQTESLVPIDMSILNGVIDGAPLPDRNEIDAVLQEVFEYSGTGLVESIIKLSKTWPNSSDVERKFQVLSGDEERLLWAYINEIQLYEAALTVDHALVLSSYRTRTGVECKELLLADADHSNFGSAVSACYKDLAPGERFAVRRAEKDGEYFFFCFLEGRSQRVHEIGENHDLRAVPRRTIFDVSFIYDSVEQVLRTSATGGEVKQNAVDKVFGSLVLGGVDLSKPPKKKVIHDLSSLVAERTFPVGTEPLVEAVALKELKFVSEGDIPGSIRLSVLPSADDDAIWGLMRESLGFADLTGLWKPVMAKFLAIVKFSGGRTRPKAFSVSYPRRCSLAYTEQDKALRRLLKVWSINVEGTQDTNTSAT